METEKGHFRACGIYCRLWQDQQVQAANPRRRGSPRCRLHKLLFTSTTLRRGRNSREGDPGEERPGIRRSSSAPSSARDLRQVHGSLSLHVSHLIQNKLELFRQNCPDLSTLASPGPPTSNPHFPSLPCCNKEHLKDYQLLLSHGASLETSPECSLRVFPKTITFSLLDHCQ